MKVVIFCGGQGLRMRESSDVLPKPMIPIGNRPILWHVMKYYAHFGFNGFVLCLGYKVEAIKHFFLTYSEAISRPRPVELSADNHRALYVPGRFAHGYQVLEDVTETSYQVGEFYAPVHEGGLSYDDPGLGLSWPLQVSETSEKDRVWPLLSEIEPEVRARMAAAEERVVGGPVR
jgi:dTDP-4-dehydrorhamnose 3,5-epimerase